MPPSIQEALEILNDWKIESATRLEALDFLRPRHAQDLSAVCEVDLHCHSFHSDGYNSPSMKVFEAWRRRMRAVAIADHDNFDGQWEAVCAGQILSIRVIPAVEFYTDRPGVEIIGHFPDTDAFMDMLDSGLADDVISKIKTAKSKQLSAMIDSVPACLAVQGFDAVITEDDVNRFVRNGVSTKGDISVILWQKYGADLIAAGLATDVKDLHAKFTTRRGLLDHPMELDLDISPESFVRRILRFGGLPGLAHPCELRNKEGLGNKALEELLESLGKAELQSIEVDGWRNTIDPETGLHQTDLFEKMRQEYNKRHPERLPLIATNGSDDHNQPGEGLELGCGKNHNLRPDFGRFSTITEMEERFRSLHQS